MKISAAAIFQKSFKTLGASYSNFFKALGASLILLFILILAWVMADRLSYEIFKAADVSLKTLNIFNNFLLIFGPLAAFLTGVWINGLVISGFTAKPNSSIKEMVKKTNERYWSFALLSLYILACLLPKWPIPTTPTLNLSMKKIIANYSTKVNGYDKMLHFLRRNES